MAKPLSPKSQLIREAIAAHPKLGNTQLAELINGAEGRKTDKIQVNATDVSNQAPAVLRRSTARRRRRRSAQGTEGGEQGRRSPAGRPSQGRQPRRSRRVRVFDLAERCGGFGQLKRLVDRIAESKGK